MPSITVVSTLLLYSFVLIGVLAQTPANFQRFSLTERNPDAVCNDGSPATYFLRTGSGSGANIWTVYLEGGYYCYDIPSCQARAKSTYHFMTSTQLPQILNDSTVSPDVNHGGINTGTSDYNPHFYNANQVYVWYCSSDTWTGNRSASAETGGYAFKGKVIVQTVFEDLAANNPQFKNAQNVLLIGFSAGAMGALHNADFVGNLVSKLAPNANYRTYTDSMWMMDVPAYQGSLSARDMMQTMITFTASEYDDTCMSVYQAIGEQWRCAFPIYEYPHVTTPLFVAGYQYDTPFLGVNKPTNATQAEFVSFLRLYFLMETTPMKTLFSPNCWCHGVVAYDARWNHIVVQGITASDFVWKWLTSNPPLAQHAVDSCQSIACNPTCDC